MQLCRSRSSVGQDWTPCGGSTHSGYTSPEIEARQHSMFMRLLADMDAVGGRTYSQAKSVRGPAVHCYVCGYVKHLTTNSAIEQDYVIRGKRRAQG